MYTGNIKAQNEMQGKYTHPGVKESEDFKAADNANNPANDNEEKEIVAETNYFDNTRQFEYNMDGESLW